MSTQGSTLLLSLSVTACRRQLRKRSCTSFWRVTCPALTCAAVLGTQRQLQTKERLHRISANSSICKSAPCHTAGEVETSTAGSTRTHIRTDIRTFPATALAHSTSCNTQQSYHCPATSIWACAMVPSVVPSCISRPIRLSNNLLSQTQKLVLLGDE